MVSASILVQARRRAGLSQRALADRAGVAQQEIARYERGRVTPSLERLRALVAACDLELTFGLARADDSYDQQIASALALTPAQRLGRALADAQGLRTARARTTGTPVPGPLDVDGVLGELDRAGVSCVLIGELAEVLHGSPLLPISGTVTIVARAGQRDEIAGVIAVADGRPTGSQSPWLIDAPASFALERYRVNVEIVPAPAGTRGYEDLARDATAVSLDDGLTVTVCSLVDLVRIAEASEDRARVPALRRTLELTPEPSPAATANAA